MADKTAADIQKELAQIASKMPSKIPPYLTDAVKRFNAGAKSILTSLSAASSTNADYAKLRILFEDKTKQVQALDKQAKALREEIAKIEKQLNAMAPLEKAGIATAKSVLPAVEKAFLEVRDAAKGKADEKATQEINRVVSEFYNAAKAQVR